MAVESNTTEVRRATTPAAASRAPAAARSADGRPDAATAELIGLLPSSPQRFIACAPGRLDVMGGLAECTGASIVNMPIGGPVVVAAAARDDDQVSITCVPHADSGNGSPSTFSARLRQLLNEAGEPIEADAAQRLPGAARAGDAWSALAALMEFWRVGALPGPQPGVSIAIASRLAGVAGVASRMAVSGAALAAVAALHGKESKSIDVSGVCQRVAHGWFGLPIGPGDARCILHGEAGTLQRLDQAEPDPEARLALDGHFSLVAVACGGRATDALAGFVRARVAAFMGRALIERIVRHEDPSGGGWNGHLSCISVDEYVQRFRDRLPLRIRGSEFLDRFGETGDPLTRIEPTYEYKVRSRTEHHVYEHARVLQFVECLTRACREPSEERKAALNEAGSLMLASHWGYGQRCGLGDARADLLVQLLRRHGQDRQVFGARVTDRGCGGVVAVLAGTGGMAEEAIGAALDAFETQTGCSATVLRSTHSGTWTTGVRAI